MHVFGSRTFLIGTVITVAAIFSASHPGYAADMTVRASVWHPPKHPVTVSGYKPFMKYVEKNSEGRIDFKFWAGGSLLGAKASLPGVENDIADISVLALTYFPAKFPHAQLISDMALLSNNAPAVTAAVTELVTLHCKPCLKDFTDKGLIFTSAYSTTPYLLISKSPIKSVEDLKGKKFRSGGPLWDRWTKSVGGTPITVPASEMFESLDRGGIDVVLFASSGLQSFSLWDTAKYVTNLKLGTYAAMSTFTFNQDFWSDLSEKDRRLFLNAAAVGTMGVTFGYEDQGQEALDRAKKHGVNIIQPSKGMVEERNKFRKKDLEMLKQEANQRYGIEDGPQIIDTYTKLLKKWEGIIDKTNGDREKMVEAMQHEIYDKIDLSKFGL